VVSMNSSSVPEPVADGVYEDAYGEWWRYLGLSVFGDFYFVALRTPFPHHQWISKEKWKQNPMQELSPRDRPRPPVRDKTTPPRFVVSMNMADGATNSSGFAKGDKVQIFWLPGVIHGRCPANGRLGVKFGNHQFENIDAMYLRPIAVREHGSYSNGDKVEIHGQPAEVHGETFRGGPILVKINSDYQYCRVDAQYLRRA